MKEGWTYKKLGEVYDVRDGTHDSPKYQSKGYPLVTSKNLRDGILDMSNVNFISQLDYNMINQRSKVDVGDVLFAMIGTIGNPVYVEDEPEYAIKNMALFKVPENQSGKFLRYFLLNDNILSKMQKESKGTTQKFVSLGYLRNFIISIPTLSEQQRIVSRLDSAFAHIDELKANAEKQFSEVRALFQKALTKAMEPKEGWEEKKLGDIAKICLGLTHTPKYTESGVHFVSVKDISNGVLKLEETKFISKEEFDSMPSGAKPQKGDLLFCRVGTIGKPQILKTDTPFGIFVSVGFLRIDDDSLTEYVKYWMDSPLFHKQVEDNVQGSTLKNLNTGWLKNFIVPIPPKKNIKRIVSRLDSLSAHVRELEEVTQKTIAECDALKQALLRKVFE